VQAAGGGGVQARAAPRACRCHRERSVPRVALLVGHAAVWLPFSLGPQMHPLRNVLPSSDQTRKSCKHVVTMEICTGHDQLRPKAEEHVSMPVLQPSRDLRKALDLDGNSTKLREEFWVAVSEAKLAQARSLAARRDVNSLKAAMESSKRLAARQRALGKTASDNSAPIATATTLAVKQLRDQQEQLREAERTVKKELEDVERQNARLVAELQRRDQRLLQEAVAAQTETEEHTRRPADEEEPVASVPAVVPKFLATSMVLPVIQSPQRQRQPGRGQTPRQAAAGLPRASPRKARRDLQVCTSAALPSLGAA